MVVVPTGDDVTGPLFLGSHVEVHLEAGATLLGSEDIDDYPAIEGRSGASRRRCTRRCSPDGINPDSCRNVRISNCDTDAGEDCITIKSGFDGDGRRVGEPCQNVVVTNCTMYHGHGGVVIGSEMSGDVRNVTVSNCVFDGTDNGLRIKTERGRGRRERSGDRHRDARPAGRECRRRGDARV